MTSKPTFVTLLIPFLPKSIFRNVVHWSCIVSQQLQNSPQVQKYKDLITKYEEQKQIYYHYVYQQGYGNGRNCKKPQHQYKPIDVSKLFEPYYHAAQMSQQLPVPSDFDDPLQQKWEQERIFQIRV